MQKKRKLWFWISSSAVILLIILIGGYSYLPLSKKQVRQSFARIECKYNYALVVKGKSVAFFNDIDTDSVFTDLSYNDKSAIKTVSYPARWINRFQIFSWCRGRLLSPVSFKSEERILNLTDKNLPYLIEKEKRLLKRKVADLKSEIAELKYYLSRHDVQDEGFTTISTFAAKVKADHDTLVKLSKIIHSISNLSEARVRYVPQYTVIYKDDSLHTKRLPCVLLTDESQGCHVILQTTNHRTPHGVKVLSPYQYRKYAGGDLRRKYQEAPKKEKPLNGHAISISPDGDYYEGRWENGKRNGFGFSVAPYRNVRAGEWKNDVFLGERMVYTSERIYGIDISRYQHATRLATFYVGKGRKKRKVKRLTVIPIEWSKLRITHLGNISKKTVQGEVDYPVSFVYIKSTEGKSLRSAYYGYDYKMAHRYGFHVGTYHFFSTTSSAETQAKFFLRHSVLRRGDLPPALDVEPTKEQIKKMGGTEVLLTRVVEWLKIVESHTGVKPILYVSQMFVNRYLNDASYIKDNYQVWIARYGEYKPDVKLIYWQLCPDGRVSGIKGEVDINVFNGYREQFDDFITNGSIR